MRVIDAFPFFNELDLLEIRLHELADVVDKFLIVEATHTFSGRPKPLYFHEYSERFAAFWDQIEYRCVTLDPQQSAWTNEEYQRNAIDPMLTHCNPDDLILLSDADEIPSASAVGVALRYQGCVGFRQRMSWYHLNTICRTVDGDQEWIGTKAFRYRDWTRAQEMRRATPDVIIDRGGWHFSYQGGVAMIQEKVRGYSHTEYDRADILDEATLARRIAAGQDVFQRGMDFRYVTEPLDNTYPRYLVRNRARFAHMLAEVAG